MGQLAPFSDEQRAKDPKRRPGAYIAAGPDGRRRLFEVIGECRNTVLLEVENCATNHRSTLSLFEVKQARLIQAAPPDEQPSPGSHFMGAYERALNATPDIPDPDDGKGDD